MKTDEFASVSNVGGADTPNTARPTARVRLPRRVRERQMIEAATDVFGALGYHNASMDQIAEKVGISKPMVYAYFDSKEGLYAACLARAGEDLVDRVHSSFDAGFGPDKALWEGFMAFFEFVRERPSDWKIVRQEFFYDVPAFTEIVQNVHDNLRSVIEELSAIASKETPGDPFADPERRAASAYAILGAGSALANRWLEDGAGTAPEVPCTQLMNFFWLGYSDLAAGNVWSAESLSN
jgi:AcrR family transcriptional regulator